MSTRPLNVVIARILLLSLLFAVPATAELPEAVKAQLATSQFVYIASTRKSGTLGKPAEIWFLFHNGAVYVGTPPTSWRVKRIKAGRPAAQIAVGKADGPSFAATGAVVKEPDTEALMLETYAKKYPEGWARFDTKFRAGFKDGSRVLVKYTPK